MQLRHGLAHHLDRDGMPVLVPNGHLIGVFAACARVLIGHGPPLMADEVEDRQTHHFRQGVARKPRQRVVAVSDQPVAVKENGLIGDFGEFAHALFTLAHGTLGLPAVGDVRDQQERAQLLFLRAEVRDQVHLDHAGLSTGDGLFAHVLHMLPAGRALDIGLYGQPCLGANGLLHGQAHNGCDGMPVVGGIPLVGKLAAQAGQVEIGHQGRDGVGDQPQQRVAGALGSRNGGF